MDQRDTGDPDIRRLIGQEAEVISSAMRMVSAGAVTRMVVAGLRLTDAALTVALGQAGGLEVVAEVVRRADETGHDVIIRRATPTAD